MLGSPVKNVSNKIVTPITQVEKKVCRKYTVCYIYGHKGQTASDLITQIWEFSQLLPASVVFKLKHPLAAGCHGFRARPKSYRPQDKEQKGIESLWDGECAWKFRQGHTSSTGLGNRPGWTRRGFQWNICTTSRPSWSFWPSAISRPGFHQRKSWPELTKNPESKKTHPGGNRFSPQYPCPGVGPAVISSITSTPVIMRAGCPIPCTVG